MAGSHIFSYPARVDVGGTQDPGPVGDLVSQVVDYAIVRLDPEGVIETWNLGAERVKGYTAEEAVGRSFTIFYTAADQEAGLPFELLGRARDEGRAEHEGWRVRQDGTRFWADVIITALRDDQGRLTGYTKVTRDLTERHALEEALRASEERLQALVGQVVDYAIIALDPTGVIESWNLGAERVKGYTAEEAVGRSFTVFYTPEDRAAGLPERLLHLARTDGRVEHTGWRLRKDGTRFWGDVVITALHDPEGRLTGFAKVTRDRSDVKALEDAQDAFYAGFRHDFRTPVTAINGFVEALREGDPEMRDFLIDRVQANADRLLGMVDGLVEFARQRAGHAVLDLVDTLDLVALTRQAVADLSPELGADRVRVQDTVASARADAGAMHRVLTNLLVNALKYSPAAEPVEVTFSATRAGWVVVRVQDHGRGIHADDVATIFDSFSRGRLATEDGGTGLGLTSVRDLVHEQGGTVWIVSDPQVGTTVAVELPRPPTTPPAPRDGQSSGVVTAPSTVGRPSGQPSG